ncbi:Vps62-related protein [Pyxidicoccus sp. 3LG]
MTLFRTFRLRWLSCLAGAALLGACSAEDLTGTEPPGEGAGESVEELGAWTNLALGKPTSQSTTDAGGAPSRAVDGNINGNYGQGSVTHTASQLQPWWQVDLQGIYPLATVVLYNRTDCCSDRLQRFRVRVSEDGVSWQDQPYAGIAPQQTSFTINRPARYVRMQLDGTGIVSLAEVQVFASQQPGGARAGNTLYGHWSGSGGTSPSSPANRQFLLDFSGPSETVTFQLTSSANAYLYLLDANGNVIAEDDNGGGGTHARISRVLPAGSYKLVAATASPGQSAEFTLSADKALLRYPQRLWVQAATQFLWVYDDHETGSNNDVAIWRANLAAYPGYYSLGDVGMPFHGVPPRMTFVVAGEGDTLARPVDYNWLWSDWGSGGAHDVSFWDPVPPAGYACLGTVTAQGYNKPSTDLIRCLKREYVLPGNFGWLWNDSGSGADHDLGLWQTEPRDHRGLALSTFKGQGNHNGPDLGRAWVLNKSATANSELQGLPVDGQMALQFAPRIWLHPGESYFPSSVEFFLPNLHVEGNNLVTNQPLGCDSCTDPQFLDGQRPDQSPVPMYVEIVHRTQGGQPTNITDLIYWTFYPYNNGKRVCIGWYSPWGCAGGYSTFGNHVGDWEHLTVRFIEGRPYAVYLSQHSSGQTFLFGAKELAVLGWHPEAYAALGSHGLYPDAARHIYENLPNGDFLADDTGRGLAWDGWAQLVLFPWQPMGSYTGSLDWLNITSDWGNPASGCSWSEPVSGQCVLNGGPTAPMRKTFSQPEALVLE